MTAGMKKKDLLRGMRGMCMGDVCQRKQIRNI